MRPLFKRRGECESRFVSVFSYQFSSYTNLGSEFTKRAIEIEFIFAPTKSVCFSVDFLYYK